MNHQGLRWNVHCVANVGLRKRLNLYKRGFKIYDLLVLFFCCCCCHVERPRPPLGRTKDIRESRDQRCLFAKSFWNMHTRTVFGYYFLYCVLNIFSFGGRFEGNNKYAKKGIASAMEYVDLAIFSSTTWQIRSCLLCKFISPGACPLSFRQENRIVELF